MKAFKKLKKRYNKDINFYLTNKVKYEKPKETQKVCYFYNGTCKTEVDR